MFKERGLTLIEVLIALAILAIALTAVVKATTQTIKHTNYLQDKMLAIWLGESILNNVRVGVIQLDKNQEKNLKTTHMLGRNWYWRLASQDTPNVRIKKVLVEIFAREDDADADDDDAPAVIRLETFIYHSDEEVANTYVKHGQSYE